MQGQSCRGPGGGALPLWGRYPKVKTKLHTRPPPPLPSIKDMHQRFKNAKKRGTFGNTSHVLGIEKKGIFPEKKSVIFKNRGTLLRHRV